MNPQIILNIALPTPLRRYFDYLPPEDSLFDTAIPASSLQPGCRVLVPFGNQKLIGILVAIKESSDIKVDKLKHVINIIDEEPILSTKILQLMLWAADYYQHPVGECLATALPSLLRKGQPLLVETETCWQLANPETTPADLAKNAKAQHKIVHHLNQFGQFSSSDKQRLEFSSATINTLVDKQLLQRFEKLPESQLQVKVHHNDLKLNDEQQQLIDAFHASNKKFQPFLLEGITGSGKTEVYLQLIEQVLAQGKQALVLVPEIGLTPQTLSRFQNRFDCPMAIFHSNLTDRQRLLHWQQARSGIARIIIGTRSALFTATDNLGLIIIDEEHDLSYKQQEGLRYSARDLACVRAKLEDIPIVMGSATPTLESLMNVEAGKYQHWALTERAGGAQPPEIEIVNIRNQPMLEGIAEAVLPQIQGCLQRKEQVLIFINRRGFAPSLLCHDCGWISQCHACDARLTIHLGAKHLRCHHCQSIEPIPHQCPQCQSSDLVYHGVGTERIEKSLKQQFSGTPIFRIDRDTTSSNKAMPEMLENIHRSEDAILVGTQMLAKGHHFPNVTLVLILEADAALAGTDYRASERFGQLLTQVIGRAGRAKKPGRALIQTHYPNQAQLNQLVLHGFHRFAMDLLAERQQLHLPPFSYQALLRLEDKDPQAAMQTLTQLQQSLGNQPCQCIGPFPASLQRRAHYFRYQLLIQANSRSQLKQSTNALVMAAEKQVKTHKQRWSIDIDPMDMS